MDVKSQKLLTGTIKDTVKVFNPIECAAILAEFANVPIKIVIASDAITSNHKMPTLAIPNLRYSFNVANAIALKKEREHQLIITKHFKNGNSWLEQKHID
jgi:hypothetical protein